MIGTNKGGGSRRPARLRKSIDYRGERYSRRGLALLLASEWGRPRGAIEQMLMVCGDDVAAVRARYDRPREERRITRASEPRRERNPRLFYNDKQFDNLAAFARYFAPQIGRTPGAVVAMLSKYGGNIDAVVRYYRRHPTARVCRKLFYNDKQFDSRRALAAHLAPQLGRDIRIVEQRLRYHNDVPERVVEAYRRLNNHTHKIAVTVNGKTYTSKAEYARKLHRRYRVLFATCCSWIHYYGAEEATERAKAYARKRAKRPKQDRTVVVFGWRWPSFSAMYRYYGGTVNGKTTAGWEDHLATGRPACLYPQLAAKLARWWEAGYLDERNRFSPEVEARMPRKDLPLNVEPEAVTDPMERSMIDALQPPEVMTIRRSCLKKLHEMMISMREGSIGGSASSLGPMDR